MTSFESMSPCEQGWFLGQIDEVLAGNYNEEQYRALWSVCKNGDAHVLYHDDGLRRAVMKFVDEYVERTIGEVKRLGLEQTPTNLAHVVGAMCCLAGMAVGMNVDVEGE